jgi:hypothetical protein
LVAPNTRTPAASYSPPTPLAPDCVADIGVLVGHGRFSRWYSAPKRAIGKPAWLIEATMENEKELRDRLAQLFFR